MKTGVAVGVSCCMALGSPAAYGSMGLPDSSDSARQQLVQEPVDGTRLAIVGGTMLVGMAAIHIYQQNGWWKNNRTSFHFREDLKYGLWIDKLGHFYGASVMTFVFSRALLWAHMTETNALLIGAGTGALFQTYIEVQDGFSAWGFDRVDFAANVAGAFYPVLQHSVPFFRDVNCKFSYHPSELLHKPGGVGFVGQQHIIFDDYEGQTIWLSLNVNSFLPGSVEPYWPDWLALAAGYAVRGVAGPDPHGTLLLALDYDMTKIIPRDTGVLRMLGEALNFIHFPSPAIRILPDTIWYGLYF